MLAPGKQGQVTPGRQGGRLALAARSRIVRTAPALLLASSPRCTQTAAYRAPPPHLVWRVEQLRLRPAPAAHQAQQHPPLGLAAAQSSIHHLVAHAAEGGHPARKGEKTGAGAR